MPTLLDRPLARPQLQYESFRQFIRTINDNVEAVCDAIWLEEAADVQFLYAIDFQELHNFMYPLRIGDTTATPSRNRFQADDVLASETLASFPQSFLMLDGTYLELIQHILSIESQIGVIRHMGLTESSLAPLREFLNYVNRSIHSGDISIGSSPAATVELASVELARYQQGFARLCSFLQTKVISLSAFIPPNAPKIRADTYESILHDLTRERSGDRDSIRNEADALNVAAMITLNDYFADGYEIGLFEKRNIVRLFTHTPSIFRAVRRSSRHNIELSYQVFGQTVPLLAKPGLLYLSNLCRLDAAAVDVARLSERSVYDYASKLRRLLFDALESYDHVVRDLLRRPSAGEPDQMVAVEPTSARVAVPANIREFDHLVARITRALEHPVIDRLRQDLVRLAPLGTVDEEVGSHSSASVPSVDLVAAADRVSHQLETARWLLEGVAQEADQRLRFIDIRMGSRLKAADSLPLAEELGLLRPRNLEVNRAFQCLETRLTGRDEKLLLAIDLYPQYYSMSWPTRTTINSFWETISRALVETEYSPGSAGDEPQDFDVEGLVAVDAQGMTHSAGLELPLPNVEDLFPGIQPVLVRINARRLAFVCEVVGAASVPLTGIVGMVDTLRFIPYVYSRLNPIMDGEVVKAEVETVEMLYRSGQIVVRSESGRRG